MDDYCEDEICLEKDRAESAASAALLDLAVLKLMFESCTELQFVSKLVLQSCCLMGITY